MALEDPRLFPLRRPGSTIGSSTDRAVEEMTEQTGRVVVWYAGYGRFVVAGGGGGGVEWRPYLAQESGQVLVDEGVDRARQAAPQVRVNGQAEVGVPIRDLVEASRSADLLVVGTRGYTRSCMPRHGRSPSSEARSPLLAPMRTRSRNTRHRRLPDLA
jgi:nucleotide-binding universal stress UspA family protein